MRPLDGFRDSVPRLIGRQKGANPLAFDPAGKVLASGDQSGRIGLWAVDGEVGGPLQSLETEEEVTTLRFDPQGSWLAVGHRSGKVSLWDLTGPRGLPPLELAGGSDLIEGLAFHPNGHWLATGGQGETASVWPVDRPFPRVLFRSKARRGAFAARVVFAPDSTWVAAVAEGDRLRLWPLAPSGVEPIDREVGAEAIVLAADPKGRTILAGTTAGAALIPLSGGPIKKLSGFEDRVGTVAFSPDGRFAAAGGGLFDVVTADRFIRVWDLEASTFQDLKTEQQIIYLAFLPDGRLLFVSGPVEGREPRQSLYRWTIGARTAELLKERVGQGWLDYDLSPDGTRLLAQGRDGALLHDLRDGSFRLIARDVKRCRFAKKGLAVVCSSDVATVRVIPLDGGAPYDLLGHRRTVVQLDVSPDDRFIASVGSEGTVRLWPMPEGEPLLSLPREQFVARLRSFTNVRAVLDEKSASGWDVRLNPSNPGWEGNPTW